MKYKGGVSLSILSGKRALEDYNRKNADIYRISALLSKKPNEVADGVERLLAELAEKSGFNTVVSYTMAFRLFMDETPSEWCRKERAKILKPKK